MSYLEEIGDALHELTEMTQSSALWLYQLCNDISEMRININYLLEGHPSTSEIVGSLRIADLQLTKAYLLLGAAADAGVGWIEQNIGSSPAKQKKLAR